MYLKRKVFMMWRSTEDDMAPIYTYSTRHCERCSHIYIHATFDNEIIIKSDCVKHKIIIFLFIWTTTTTLNHKDWEERKQTWLSSLKTDYSFTTTTCGDQSYSLPLADITYKSYLSSLIQLLLRVPKHMRMIEFYEISESLMKRFYY